MKLLTKGNPKTLKGQKKGYMTFILHLAPANLSGFNVCPMATEGCKAACLNTAGRGGIPAAHKIRENGRTFANSIQAARVRRTRYYFEHRAEFMTDLIKDIQAAVKYALKRKLTPVFRLNGTSDIRWESVAIDNVNLFGRPFRNIMTAFPTLQFYDYTKLTNRKDIPANYHLTFSLAESNRAQAETTSLNVAAVFPSKALPATFMGRPVFNGDDSDLRFLDPPGVIVGLYAKGKAKYDRSGFVQRVAI